MSNFWPKWQDNKLFTIIVAVFMIVVVVTLVLIANNAMKQNYFIGKSIDQTRTITIAGEGKVTAIPDVSVIDMGYQVEKKTVAEAQKDNSVKMNGLIKSLKDLGIDAKDIKTTSYYVSPQYDWADNKQTLRGYQVSQNVEVKVRNTDNISKVLDLVGQLGLNQVNNITFTIDDPTDYQQDARIKALENAKEKANELAKVMGVSLGKVVSFTEDSNYLPVASPMYSKSDSMGMGGVAAAPAVEQGSQEIIVNASVTYELN